jgi:nucleoside 2-deoxyribosyltransferase
MKIYLCGPINGCTDDEAMTWRDWFKQQPEDLCNPDELLWVDPMKRDYRGRESEDYREIVDLDKRDVREVDVLVVMYTQPSVGTSMEIFYAWTIGKPVIVINESNKPISPWLRYHATAIVRTKELALEKVKEWLL